MKPLLERADSKGTLRHDRKNTLPGLHLVEVIVEAHGLLGLTLLLLNLSHVWVERKVLDGETVTGVSGKCWYMIRVGIGCASFLIENDNSHFICLAPIGAVKFLLNLSQIKDSPITHHNLFLVIQLLQLIFSVLVHSPRYVCLSRLLGELV